MKLPRNVHYLRAAIDPAALAGPLLLLLATVLIQSSLVLPTGAHLRLPQASGLPGHALATVTVSLDAAGRLFLDHQISSEQQLRDRIVAEAARRAGDVSVLLQVDRGTTAQELARLMNLARAAGARTVIFATVPSAAQAPRSPDASAR